MTPSEQWMLGLFAVYSIPAFALGVGMTLALVRWLGRRTVTIPSFLSPERTFERRDVIALGFAPADNSRNPVRNGLRLR